MLSTTALSGKDYQGSWYPPIRLGVYIFSLTGSAGKVYTYYWPKEGVHVLTGMNGKGVMMMIRVNIHFERSTLDRLDGIKDKVCELPSSGIGMFSLTRADLIRFAVAQVFRIKCPYVHVDDERISLGLKQVLKKSASSKRV